MGKGKKGGGKRTKVPVGRTVAKILLLVDGGRRIVQADYTTIGWHIDHGSKLSAILKDPAVINKLKPVALGAGEIIIGPKGVDMLYRAVPAPEVKRLRMPGSSRKVF